MHCICTLPHVGLRICWVIGGWVVRGRPGGLAALAGQAARARLMHWWSVQPRLCACLAVLLRAQPRPAPPCPPPPRRPGALLHGA